MAAKAREVCRATGRPFEETTTALDYIQRANETSRRRVYTLHDALLTLNVSPREAEQVLRDHALDVYRVERGPMQSSADEADARRFQENFVRQALERYSLMFQKPRK